MKISNEELTKELIKSQLSKKLQPRLKELFVAMVNRQIDRPHYHKSINHEELKAQALRYLVKWWMHCSLAQTDNPYGYFVQLIHVAVKHFIARSTLPKHGEVWEKLPCAKGLCSVGWSLGVGVHEIDTTKALSWGTNSQIRCGCLRLVKSRYR